MNDIEDRLVAAGERFRRTQAMPPNIDLSSFQRTPRRWRTVIIAAAAIAAIAVAATAFIGHKAAQRAATTATAPTTVTAVGERVRATGVLMQSPGKDVVLCAQPPAGFGVFGTAGGVQVGGLDPLMGPGVGDSCGGLSVPVTGLTDLTKVPGWTTTDGVGASAEVMVVGAWTGTALAASSVGAPDLGIASAASQVYPIPCAEPTAGWDPTPVARTASEQISAVVNADKDLYAGVWTATSPEAGNPQIFVVAVAGDLKVAEAQIRTFFHGNLCLTAEPFSLNQQAALKGRLLAARPGWSVISNPVTKRLMVSMPIYDQAAANVIGSDIDNVTILPVVTAST